MSFLWARAWLYHRPVKAHGALLLGLLLPALAAAQAGVYPPALIKDNAPAATDVLPVWKVGEQRAKRTDPVGLWRSVAPTVEHVMCRGVDDTAALNAGVLRIQTIAASTGAGGGALWVHGNCVYNGAGIVNDPASGTTSHLVIRGDGISSTTLNFTGCSNSQCILLGSGSSIGSGRSDGSGIHDLTITAPTTVDAVVLRGLQRADVYQVMIYGGATAITVAESRDGTVRDLEIRNPGVNGLKITGESFAANFFQNITLVASGATGTAVLYQKAGTGDAGGVYLTRVVVNGSWAGSGFKVSSTTLNNIWVFLMGCVADGSFGVASFTIERSQAVAITDGFAGNSYTNAPGVILDAASDVTINGGLFAATGGGPDVSLKNSVARTLLADAKLWGSGTTAIQVDGTTHDVTLRLASVLPAALTNDATKLVPSASSELGWFVPKPTTSKLGGVQAKTAVTNQFLTSISTSGVPASAQPAFSDLSGTATDAMVTNDLTIASTSNLSTTGRASVGTATAGAGLTVVGSEANNTAGAADTAAVRIVNTNTGAVGRRSGLQFGIAAGGKFAEIAGSLNDGSGNTGGDIIVSVRKATGDTNLTDVLAIVQAGHVVAKGAAPTISCTGLGSSPPTTTITGNDIAFAITAFTGTSPSSTGSCTVTFAGSYAGTTATIACTLVSGGSAWGNGSTVHVTTESVTAPVLTWTNLVGGTATALTGASSYKISCLVIGK